MSDSGFPGEFAIPPLAHTGLFGAFLGCHAISDAIQVLHTGVGCKGKTQVHLVEHDLGREAHAKVGWTELTEAEWIQAPLVRLREAARELCRRRRPGGIVLTTSTAVEYTGVDLEAAAEAVEGEVGVPVLALPGVASSPDLYSGYSAVVRALLGRVDWSRPPAEGLEAALAGYFFHRYEHEQAANLAELRRLAEGLGVNLGPVLLSGEPMEALLAAHHASAVLGLPYLGLDDAALGRLTMRPAGVVGLPLGLRATTRWLQALGGPLGVEPERVRRLIEREEGRASSRLGLARRVLSGRSLAIIADTPLVAGFMLLAQELGLTCPLVALLDRSLGGEEGLRALLDQVGARIPVTTKVLVAPSLLELRDLGGPLEPRAGAAPFDLVVRPDLGLAGTGWASIPTVEVGFPARRKHFVFPLPELGYAGAVALAGRLMDALFEAH